MVQKVRKETHFVNTQLHKSSFNKFFPQLMMLMINKMFKIGMQKIRSEKIEEISKVFKLRAG